MLVSMKDILDRANAENYAVLAPNIFSELDARVYIEAAEEMHAPIILGVAFPTTNDIAFIGNIAVSLAKQSNVPVAVHLDHGANMGQVMEAVHGGFTSVMLDASALPFDENVRQVKQVVETVSHLGISVEAEIGHVGQGINYNAGDGLTDPAEAKAFIEATGIDACAVAIGTAHGAYKGTPKLDFDRLVAIKEMTGIPLVLHGSSGTGKDNISKACKLGINKVNVCNDLLKAAYDAVKQTDFKGNDVYDFWPFIAGTLREFVKKQIDMVGSAGKSWSTEQKGLPRGVVTMHEGEEQSKRRDNMPLSFALEQKTKVLSGAGTIGSIAEVIETAGYKKPFIVTDKGIIATGTVDKVINPIKAAGIEFVLFDEVTPDPKDVMVEKAAVICKEQECDCVVAIGGGAAIDTAKGVTVLRFNPGRILDYGRGAEMCYCPGLIAIPTTAGTGAELSNGMIISDSKTDEKVPIVGTNAMSEYIIVDPEVTVGMPKALTAFTGLDSFAHAMEAYTTILTSPVIAPICEKIMEDVVEFLPRAIADGKDMEARERLHVNASIGGWMLANACAHVGHSLAHTIGGYLHIPHGAACAYAAPVTIKHIAPAVPEKVKKIGLILGASFNGFETPEEIGRVTAAAYMNFRDNVVKLDPVSKYNIAKEDAAALASKIPAETFAPLTPVPVTEEIAAAMLEEIFA